MPIIVMWDGIVSVLRTYTVDELNELKDKLNASDTFYWEVGIKKGKASSIVYLLGIPKNQMK